MLCSSGTGLVPANYLESVANSRSPNYITSSNGHTSFLNNLRCAKVIYDYQSQVDEELTVTQNDIVTFIENSEPEWIKVTNIYIYINIYINIRYINIQLYIINY